MKRIKFAILSVLFVLCCVFTFLSNNFIGLKANESTNENTQDEIVEDETLKEEVIEDVKEVANETEQLINVIVGIVASLGISWGSIATVIKWIKGKLKNANTDLATTYEKLTEAKEEITKLKDLIEQELQTNDELRNQLNEVKELLKDFYERQEIKQYKIDEVLSKTLKESVE